MRKKYKETSHASYILKICKNIHSSQVIREPKGLLVFDDDVFLSNPAMVLSVCLTGVNFIVKAIRKDFDISFFELYSIIFALTL